MAANPKPSAGPSPARTPVPPAVLVGVIAAVVLVIAVAAYKTFAPRTAPQSAGNGETAALLQKMKGNPNNLTPDERARLMSRFGHKHP